MGLGMQNTRHQHGVWGLVTIFLAGLLVLAAPARSSEVEKGGPQEWVDMVELPVLPQDRLPLVKRGIAHLLADRQTRYRPEGKAIFRRYAYQVVAPGGLETAASIDLDFDPSRDRIIINRIGVHRDGKWVDKLNDAKPYIYNPEKDADYGIYNGWRRAHIDVPDVRLGDIVDYASTVERTEITGRGFVSGGASVEWDEPVGLIREIVTWPTAKPLRIQQVRTDLKAEVSSSDGLTTYRWSVRNPTPVRMESDVPPGYVSLAAIEYSSFVDWSAISSIFEPIFQVTDQAPASFLNAIDDIARKYPEPEDRLIESLHFVQDTIRYVSLAMGSGSYVPRQPAEVVASGFGDCKDKSLLLVAALRRLGIEAYPALTDIDAGAALPERLPGISEFDHVIVMAIVGGRTYWVDPTESQQVGRVANLVEANFGYALPIRAGSAKLQEVRQDWSQNPTQTIQENFTFPKGSSEPLTLEVTTEFLGPEAESMRRKLSLRSVASLGQDYANYYAKSYPGMQQVEPLAVEDLRDENRLTVRERYRLSFEDLYADGLIENFPLRADLPTQLPTPDASVRSAPINVGRKRYSRHSVTVSNLKAEFNPPADANVLKPYFLLFIQTETEMGRLNLDWHFRTLTTEVPAAAVPQYRRAAEMVAKNTYFTYNFGYAEAAD